MIARAAMWVFFSLGLASCAASRGFHRESLREKLGSAPKVTDEEIAEALKAKPQLPKPFKLGVYFKEAEAANEWGETWNWKEEDRQKILAAIQVLKDKGQAKEIIPINPAVLDAFDLKSLRLAAAQHGADALLVVSGVVDVDTYTNNWAWSYMLLLPALFVKGTEADALFMSRAAMWDVRNGYLYMAAEAEAQTKQVKAAAYIDKRALVLEAKKDSMSKLAEDLAKQAQGLAK